MSKYSSVTVKEFLATNSYFIRLTIDGILMYDDDAGWSGIYGALNYQDKKISSVYIDVVEFHHYEIHITTVGCVTKDNTEDVAPVSNSEEAYQIPDEYKNKIMSQIDLFRDTFFRHLNEIFPDGWRYPEEDGGYISVDSTGGWFDALKATFIALGMEDILEYYQSLGWAESDLFDWEIEKMVDCRDE